MTLFHAPRTSDRKRPPIGHHLTRRSFLGGAAALAAAWRTPLFAEDPSTYMYVGCYTARGPGISVYKIDPATGALSLQSVATGTANPSFVVLDPHRRFLYACNEVSNVEGAGTLSSFSVDPNTGALTFLNRVTSGGGGPAHI